ncbi:HK97-gp10 family putative phage morphogenesis protein [Xanthobacter sediminis]
MSKVQGLDKLNKRLSVIPKAARAAVQPALMKAGNALAEDMRRLVPEKSGDLKDSITVTPGGESTPPYSQPGGAVVVPELQVLVTAGNHAVRYAHLVEFGTAPHENQGLFPGTQHPGATPKPFFWPAVRLNQKGLTRSIKRAIRKAVKDAK